MHFSSPTTQLALALLFILQQQQTQAAPIIEPTQRTPARHTRRQSSTAAQVPDFALQYAPYVYLHEDEQW